MTGLVEAAAPGPSESGGDALHVLVRPNPASGNSLRHLLRLITSSSIHFRRNRARSYRVAADIRIDQLGYEWDGIVAWLFAATIPARLDKLVILNGIPKHCCRMHCEILHIQDRDS